MTPRPAERAFLGALGLAILGAAATAVAVVLAGDLGEDEGLSIATLSAVFLCAGAALPAYRLLERGRLALLGAAVLVTVAADIPMFMVGIWEGAFFEGTNTQAKLVPTAFAWVIAGIVLATLPLLAPRTQILAPALALAGGAAVVGASIATALVWTETDQEGWIKVLAVASIVMVAGWLAAPIAQRVARA
jgi:hypothetical protein